MVSPPLARVAIFLHRAQPYIREGRLLRCPWASGDWAMASSTTTTGNGAGAVKSDYDALKNDVKALRDDLAALAQNAGRAASEEARRHAKKAGKYAEGAGKQVEEYRDLVEDKVRDHPFAAIGIALAAGFIVASL